MLHPSTSASSSDVVGFDASGTQFRTNDKHAPTPSAELDSQRICMNLHLTIGPVVSIIAGILILIMPRLLNYIVAIYLIVIGLLELSGNSGIHLH